MKHVSKPLHVAIIMDGNGRWAARRGLARSEGHRRGMATVRQIIKDALSLGIRYLTLYAFSSENWKRSEKEVAFLMRMCETILAEELPFMIHNDIRFLHTGRKEGLPESLRDTIVRVENLTKNNKKLCVILAFNYGSRREIVDAVRHIAADAAAGRLRPEDIDEKVIADALYTPGVPDPDLLIRTSGEMLLSNFLLWQMCYTELYVTKTFWPDFRKKDFEHAIKEFQKRQRRFGGVHD